MMIDFTVSKLAITTTVKKVKGKGHLIFKFLCRDIKKKRYTRMTIVKCSILVPKLTCLDTHNMQYPKVNGFR